VTLGDTPLGKTPAFLKKVKPGIHKLWVEDSEMHIHIGPGETRQISLYKGEFFNIPVAEKELLKLEFPKFRTTDVS